MYAIRSYYETNAVLSIHQPACNLMACFVIRYWFVKYIKPIRILYCLIWDYPNDWKIRVVLDNHSSHISKETKEFLFTRPDRFEFVFTPKHGSWLNMIGIFFSKIARGFRITSYNVCYTKLLRYALRWHAKIMHQIGLGLKAYCNNLIGSITGSTELSLINFPVNGVVPVRIPHKNQVVNGYHTLHSGSVYMTGQFRITSYNVCYTKLLRLAMAKLRSPLLQTMVV